MQAPNQASGRDVRGRFAPGQSGNPAGKQPGTRNRVSRLRALLADDDIELAVTVLMEQVRAGKGVAARFVLDRLFPKPRDRDIDLELPPPEAGTTMADMFDRVLWMMARGDITIDEASRIARLLAQRSTYVDVGSGAAEPTAGARAASAVRPAASPAFDLQTTGSTTDTGARAMPPQPPNRHERRRAAAQARTAPPPLTAVA